MQEPGNLVGMASLVALSAALLNPLPLLVGIVAEAAYLLFVPDTAWFMKRLEARFDDQVKSHRRELRDKVFLKIRGEIRDKFLWLEAARDQIEKTVTVQDQWFREALRKLDFLLEKYLQFAEREAEYLNYLLSLLAESKPNMSREEVRDLPYLAEYCSTSIPLDQKVTQQDVQELINAIQRHYDIEIEAMGANIDGEKVLATKEILTKRKEVLTRRREFVVRLSDLMVNLRHQMELIAETFGLINDEIRARSPEQVLADIDDVVMQATSLTDALDDLTPVEQVVART